MANVIKEPPKLDSDDKYENWKRDIQIWYELTTLEKSKRALAIHLSLTGRARLASSEITVADLKKDTGVTTLLEKLDNLFLPDKSRRQFLAFNKLYNLRRSSETNIKDFISEFDHVYYEFTEQSMSLPDSVIAFMLLASCNFSDSEMQLVMSAVTDVNYAAMSSAI